MGAHDARALRALRMDGGGAMNRPRRAWRTDAPQVGAIVEVWHMTTVILATWDGHGWRTTEGQPLAYITHWRARS